MSEKTKSKTKADLSLDKLSALKEIIMGAEKAELEERLEALEKQFTSALGDTQNTLGDRILKLEENLSQKITALSDHSKEMDAALQKSETDRKTLGDLLIKLGENLKK